MIIITKTKRSSRNIDAAKLEKMAHILKSISHPLRLEVLELLEEKEPQSVAEIREQIEVEQSLLSHHLTKMKDKGVLDSFREGRNIYYRRAFPEISKIFDCMDKCDIF
ncbi:MAG TPA: ArsR family transcriptional regulator [Bacteroidetes bacterium]|nr:ArsR family transcriptional regulator [Bacteroidota bacterium]